MRALRPVRFHLAAVRDGREGTIPRRSRNLFSLREDPGAERGNALIRLAIRGFIGGVKQFEERIDVSESADELEGVAERHSLRLLALPGGEKHMIELEFLDEPDPLQRFFRVGTDPSAMVTPIANWIGSYGVGDVE
jgi:hypothetical protein